jgi:hypothetical protein
MANGKMFKSLDDILNISPSDAFDDDEAQKEKIKQQERKEYVKSLKSKLSELKNSDNDTYKKQLLKMLATEGFDVLLNLKHEIEDNPSARAAEVFSSMLSSINNTVDTLDKIDNNNKKREFEQEKLQAFISKDNPLINGNNNSVLMVGSTQDLLQQLSSNGLIKEKSLIEAKAEIVDELSDDDFVTEETKEDSEDSDDDIDIVKDDE